MKIDEGTEGILEHLDQEETYETGDPQGMGDAVEGFPEQFRHALEISQEGELPRWERPAQVMILGMGGSAIGGDLLRALLEPDCPVPITVNRSYEIPGYVGPDTLVVACSYSGNTEETLAAYSHCVDRGAQVVAVTTGGTLATTAREDGFAVIEIPGGLQPRAALGYGFLPLTAIMVRAGLAPDMSGDAVEAAAILEEQRTALLRNVPAEENAAKRLAARLWGKLPLIYGSGGWRGAAAYRWKCQINENAKSPATWNDFPELNHNETVGWETPPDLTRRVEVVILRDEAEFPRVSKRVEVTREIMEPHIGGVTEVWAQGRSAMARLFSLIYAGDFTSYYLALLNGVDPSPVRVIDHLKQELAKSPSAEG